MKNVMEPEQIIELNDYLLHILPLIQNLKGYDTMQLDEIIIKLVELGVRQTHVYFQIHTDRYKEIRYCPLKNRLTLN